MAEPLEAIYELGEIIGSGGMGVVYEATQRSLGRRVAIKFPHPELATDPLVAQRFRAEAMAGGRLDHPNVARVIDYGDREGAQYLVMEHVAGPALENVVIEHGPLEPSLAVELGGQILGALEATHTAGIIHADIKSANVLVETRFDGVLVARLIDFGLARLAGESHPDDNRLLSGTPDYLAPELIHGGAPTIASDIYAAGVIVYELLTGTTPFAGGSSAEIMQRQLEDWVVPPSLRCTEQVIPAGIEDAVMRALAKDPNARFATAASFAAALRGAAPAHATLMPVLRQGSRPSVFSIEATTRDWQRDRAPVVRAASTARKGESRQVQASRVRAFHAVAGGNSDVIVTSYLELARSLIDTHELAAAVIELEHGLSILRPNGLANDVAPPAMWRLQLCLAALYSGLGDAVRARSAAVVGQADAVRVASIIGQDRSRDLLVRLARGRAK